MEYITHEGDKFVRAITLYGRYYFGGFSTQYLCWYEDKNIGEYAGHLVENDYPDMDADIIFEKAINPIWGPGTYVCVKCGNYYRENLEEIKW